MTRHPASRVRSPLLLVLLVLLALPIGLLLVATYGGRPGAATVTVRPDEQHQRIHGWEAVAQASLSHLDAFEHREEVLAELLDKAVDLGLTRLRLEARASIENTRDVTSEYLAGRIGEQEMRCGRYATVNDNADPGERRDAGFIWDSFDAEVRHTVLPMRQRLAARGEKLWVNVNYVAFVDGLCPGSAYHHDDPAEYAEFVLTVYEHLRDTFGLVPDSWEMILEPDNTRIWTGARVAAAALAAAERLKAAGFTPSIVGPSTTRASNALPYFEPSWQEAALRPYLTEMSYHRYGGATPEVIGAIGAMSRERGVPTAMLEHIGASVEALHEDLTVGNVSAWQQFALSWPEADSGAHYFVIDADGAPGERARLSGTGWYLRQYFRAFRPDGVRIGAVSDDPGFAPVAVQNVGARTAVVIKAARAGRLTVTGLVPGSYATSCRIERARWERNADICAGLVDADRSGTAVVIMPDAGVFSLVRESHVER